MEQNGTLWRFFAVSLLLLPACATSLQRGYVEVEPVRYTTCREAGMHSEDLELRAGSFTHSLVSDVVLNGSPEQTRTTGRYVIRADTLRLIYGDSAAQRRRQENTRHLGSSGDRAAELPYPRRFLLDTLGSHMILWRSADAKRLYERTGNVSPYSVLIRKEPGDTSIYGVSCASLPASS